jgi:hypothetical protein
MAISHRTNRLKIIGTPSVEQLQNGRYKLTITCSSINSREDWYSSNKARIFPDFGSLESAEMSIDGLAPRTGEAYTDMRLTEVQSGNRSPRDGSDYIVVLTYETLGDSFVQVKDDNVNYTENGLRRVTRKSIAKAGTDFQKTVGTTSITSQIDTETAVTCVLANYEVNDTDSYREVTEVYLESGILSVRQDFNNGQKRVSVQAFNKTSAEVTSALSEVTSDHKLISEQESDFAGIKTSTFEYQLDESFIQDRELNGLNRIRLIELSASDFTAQTIGAVSSTAPTSGLFLGSQVIDNGGAIKLRESNWFEAGTLNVSTKNLAEGVKQVTTVFLVTEGSTVGPVTARSTSNFQGLKTISVTTMQDKSGNALGTAGTTPVHSFEVFSNFTYPGLFVPSSSVAGQTGNLQIELTKAPAQSKVRSTVYVFFTKTSTIESSDYKYDSAVGLWSPNDWGAVSVTAAGGTGVFNTSKALRGYRTDVDTFSGSIPASFGNFAQFLFQGSLKVTATPSIGFIATINKGPSNPVGSKWVLDVKIAAAFDDVDGTTYYKKTIIVTEAIPAQESLVGGPYD